MSSDWNCDGWRKSTWGNEISLEYGKSLRDYQVPTGKYRVFGSNGAIGWTDSYLSPGPGVILGRKGAYRGVRYCDEPFFVIDTAYYVVPKNSDLDIRWLYYAIQYHKLGEIDDGSPIPSTTRAAVYVRELSVPPLNEQKAIANVLRPFDEKIELNRQTNQTLEQIAQALFKSWFVDFEPTRAKIAAKEAGASPEEIERAAMCAISGKTPDQLAQLPPETQQNLKTTAALFPDALVDTELGEVPEGWEVKAFGELLTKTIGGDWGTDAPDEKHTQEVKILRGTDLPDVYNGTDDRVPIRYVNPKKFANRKLEVGDIVIEVSGGSKDQPTGRSLFLTDEIIFRLNAELEPASFCRLFRPSDIQTGLILGLHLRKIYDEGKTWLYQNQSTGISNFQTQVFLEKELVVVPPKHIAFSFYGMVMPILRKMSSAENKRLSTLRDQLLPKLLSGEIQGRRAQ